MNKEGRQIVSLQGQQLINLLIFMVFGKVFLHLAVPWAMIALAVVTAVVAEHVLLFLQRGHIPYIVISSILTGLGVAFMVQSSQWWVYGVVIVAAFIIKYAVRYNQQHIFNPSNSAVVLALVVFPQYTAVVVGQWGASWVILTLLFLLGSFIVYRARRWIVPAVFVPLYLGLSYAVTADIRMSLSEYVSMTVVGAFLLYAFFMLTDPRTTPSQWIGQVMFAILVAVCAVTLDSVYVPRPAHLFLSLAIVSLCVPFLRYITRETNHMPSWITTASLVIVGVGIFLSATRLPAVHFVMPGIH